jgi:hypothetical protein
MCFSMVNIPIELTSTMISFKVKSRGKIETHIGGVYIHPQPSITDFNPDEFFNDFVLLINKTINFKLHIDVEYVDYEHQINITVNTRKMINWDYMIKIEKCANVLLKYRGKYKFPPKCFIIESYTPAA